VAYLWVMLIGIGVLTGVSLYEDWYKDDAAGRDFRSAYATAHREGDRAIELAQTDTGIPPEGAISLLRNDPLTQGPKLFERYCIECHQPADRAGEWTRTITAEDGTQQTVEIPPTAPELADPRKPGAVRFGSRDWIRSVLTDFAGHFAPLANMTVENGATEEQAEAADAILNGSMAGWSEGYGPELTSAENADGFEALVEFLYAQSGRADARPVEDDLVQRGREIFESGEISGEDACAGCHTMHARGEDEPVSDGLYPILTGYGGTEWLTQFIADPDAHYAGNGEGYNAMPGFADQLSPHDLEMLARWLTGEYHRAE
jgi:ubiquinol-cytochrome c reductase cytochrome b subunit